ncbi:MAG TPA: AsmA family protein [Burkholderiales bacterium]|nr:AsmA family protein [Burkholderiales bacterium]
MRALKWLGGTVAVLFVVIALFFTFGLNLLKGPITRAVSNSLGRELVIEGDLRPVWSWVHPRLRAEGVRFANADWGKADYLLNAEAVEASISVLPLLAGRLVLPDVHLQGAELSLEQDADGRKNWILKEEPEDQKKESRLFVKLLTVNEGRLRWEDAWREHSFVADLSTDDTGISFTGEGTYSGMPLKAKGHAGQVLAIRDVNTPFPINAEIKIGDTAATLEGTLTGLVGFKGIDLKIKQLSGKTMEDLYWIIGLALPDSSPYKLSGRLLRTDGMWRFENFAGKVGESDLAGTLQVDTGGERPYMHGDLVSKVLNFADLGPLVGTNQPREGGGVLPDAPFNVERWESLDSDIRLRAGTIKRPEQLPIENLSTHWQLRDKVLSLDPLEFGIAGGKLAGTIKVDGNRDPVRGSINMRVRQLQLAKLFPTVKQAQGSIGDLNGLVELTGTGASVGELLGSSNGKIGIYMDGGKISRFMMELIALQLWDAARIKLKGDEEIDIRCAIADFGVKGGVAQANAFVFDTAVVNVGGSGTINLKNEEMDLQLKPEPKDRGIGSLRTPLHVKGTFGHPNVGPDMGKLVIRGAGTIAMGILNPLLAIIPLIEEGKGKDSPCGELIAQATKSAKQSAATGASAQKGKEEKKPKDEAKAKEPPAPPQNPEK